MIQRASRLCSMLVSLMAANVQAQALQTQPPPPQRSAAVAPERDDAPGLSPTAFWFGASVTVITASLGGFYALRVRDLYDEAQGTPAVSSERNVLHDRMVRAERTADILFASAVVLATGATILAFHVDWSGPRARTHAAAPRISSPARWSVTPVILPGVQSLQLRGALP